MLKNPEVRIQLILHIILTLAGFIGCLFLNVYAAFILLGVAVLMITISLCFHRGRYRRLSGLCDEIDDILHGKEQFSFDEFKEGELGILTSEIHKMTIKLREQNAALQDEHRFMKEAMEDISHQLRTPLTSMLLILGMMRSPDLSGRQRMEYLHELYGLLDRMQWLIETLLGLSRLEAGAVSFRKSVVSCREMIAAALEPISVAMELKNITAKVEIEGEPRFYGDMQYCTEALSNILKNCMEHTPENGSITIQSSENGIYTGILITDSGKGISEEVLPHIFERFYRSSDFAQSGYGIGLAFAKKTVAAQDGSLQVRNAKPHGAQFDMRFYKTVV